MVRDILVFYHHHTNRYMEWVQRALAIHRHMPLAILALIELQVFRRLHPRNVELCDDVIREIDILKLRFRFLSQVFVVKYLPAPPQSMVVTLSLKH